MERNFVFRKFLKAQRMGDQHLERSETLAKRLKRFWIRFFHHVVGKKMDSFGVNKFRARLPHAKTLSIFRRCSTLVCSRVKLVRQEFVRFEESSTANASVKCLNLFIHSVLMFKFSNRQTKSFAKWQSTAQSGDCFCCASVMRSTCETKLTRLCTAVLLPLVWEKLCKLRKVKNNSRRESCNSKKRKLWSKQQLATWKLKAINPNVAIKSSVIPKRRSTPKRSLSSKRRIRNWKLNSKESSQQRSEKFSIVIKFSTTALLLETFYSLENSLDDCDCIKTLPISEVKHFS